MGLLDKASRRQVVVGVVLATFGVLTYALQEKILTFLAREERESHRAEASGAPKFVRGDEVHGDKI